MHSEKKLVCPTPTSNEDSSITNKNCEAVEPFNQSKFSDKSNAGLETENKVVMNEPELNVKDENKNDIKLKLANKDLIAPGSKFDLTEPVSHHAEGSKNKEFLVHGDCQKSKFLPLFTTSVNDNKENVPSNHEDKYETVDINSNNNCTDSNSIHYKRRRIKRRNAQKGRENNENAKQPKYSTHNNDEYEEIIEVSIDNETEEEADTPMKLESESSFDDFNELLFCNTPSDDSDTQREFFLADLALQSRVHSLKSSLSTLSNESKGIGHDKLLASSDPKVTSKSKQSFHDFPKVTTKSKSTSFDSSSEHQNPTKDFQNIIYIDDQQPPHKLKSDNDFLDKNAKLNSVSLEENSLQSLNESHPTSLNLPKRHLLTHAKTNNSNVPVFADNRNDKSVIEEQIEKLKSKNVNDSEIHLPRNDDCEMNSRKLVNSSEMVNSSQMFNSDNASNNANDEKPDLIEDLSEKGYFSSWTKKISNFFYSKSSQDKDEIERRNDTVKKIDSHNNSEKLDALAENNNAQHIAKIYNHVETNEYKTKGKETILKPIIQTKDQPLLKDNPNLIEVDQPLIKKRPANDMNENVKFEETALTMNAGPNDSETKKLHNNNRDYDEPLVNTDDSQSKDFKNKRELRWNNPILLDSRSEQRDKRGTILKGKNFQNVTELLKQNENTHQAILTGRHVSEIYTKGNIKPAFSSISPKANLPVSMNQKAKFSKGEREEQSTKESNTQALHSVTSLKEIQLLSLDQKEKLDMPTNAKLAVEESNLIEVKGNPFFRQMALANIPEFYPSDSLTTSNLEMSVLDNTTTTTPEGVQKEVKAKFKEEAKKNDTNNICNSCDSNNSNNVNSNFDDIGNKNNSYDNNTDNNNISVIENNENNDIVTDKDRNASIQKQDKKLPLDPHLPKAKRFKAKNAH
eukprot:Awhi_evm1s11982